MFIKGRFPVRRPEIAAAALGPGPASRDNRRNVHKQPQLPRARRLRSPTQEEDTCLPYPTGRETHRGGLETVQGDAWVSLSLQNLVSGSFSSRPLRKGCELWHKVLLVAYMSFSNPDIHSLSCLAVRARFVLHVALKQRRRHRLKDLYKWDFYLLTLPCSLPHLPFAPKANPDQHHDSKEHGGLYVPSPKISAQRTHNLETCFTLSVAACPQVSGHKAGTCLAGCLLCSPSSVPSQPRALSLLAATCWRHICAAALIYPYSYKNMYNNLHFLFLSCWFCYA